MLVTFQEQLKSSKVHLQSRSSRYLQAGIHDISHDNLKIQWDILKVISWWPKACRKFVWITNRFTNLLKIFHKYKSIKFAITLSSMNTNANDHTSRRSDSWKFIIRREKKPDYRHFNMDFNHLSETVNCRKQFFLIL